MTFHPAFHPLHTRLCGLDGELTEVPTRTLLALYPVELASYEPFLRTFYGANEIDADLLFQTTSHVPIHTVEQATQKAVPYWSSVNARRSVMLPRQIETFIGSLAGGPRSPDEMQGIRYQLDIIVRTLAAFSAWDEKAFAAQKPLIQTNFMSCVEGLCKFFDVDVPELVHNR